MRAPPAPTRPRPRRLDPSDDRGAQALELVMATPILLLLLMIVVAAGQIALGLVGTHQTAVLAARLAATRSDAAVAVLLPGEVALTVDPPTATRRPGDLLTTTVVRDLRVLWWPGPGVAVRAEATALTEQVGP